MKIQTLLASTSVFSDLNENEIKKVIEVGIIRKFRVGEWLTHQGDVWPNLIFVITGEIIALKESLEGRSLILETIGEGEVFWGLAFFLEDTPMPAALRASKESEILIWNRERLSTFLFQDGR